MSANSDLFKEKFSYLKFKTELEESDIESAFSSYHEYIESTNDRFVVLIHLLMLQNGFLHNDTNQDGSKFLSKNNFFSKLCYTDYKSDKFCIKFDSAVKIVINFMTNVNRLTVQAFLLGYQSDSIFTVNKREIDHLKTKLSYERINDLIIDFKNSILFQLKLYIHETFNSHLLIGKSLIYLPNEILNKIVKHLDLKSIISLSTVSKLFRNLLFDENILKCKTRLLGPSVSSIPISTQYCNSLWQYWLQRDFSKSYKSIMETSGDESNFYKLYKGMYSILVKNDRNVNYCNRPYYLD